MELSLKQFIGLALLFSGVVLISLFKFFSGPIVFLGIIMLFVGGFLAVKKGANPDIGGYEPGSSHGEDE